MISSPLVDLGSLVLLTSIFGAEIALLYVLLGLVVAVIGGTVIDKMRMEGYLESLVDENSETRENAWQWIQEHRLEYAKDITLATVKRFSGMFLLELALVRLFIIGFLKVLLKKF